jgi:hypothetical protein
MDADDVAQVVGSLRQALSAAGADAHSVLDQFGWSELYDDEPRVAVDALFTLSGELLIDGSMLDAVMLRSGRLARVTDAARVVLPAFGSHLFSGRTTDDGHVIVDGIVQSGAGPTVVPCVDAANEVSFAICEVKELDGNALDATAGWRRVCTTTKGLARIGADQLDDDPAVVWAGMVAAGRRALAHELTGISTAMEKMTVDHVSSREQFGQALGSFQAVKHQLADVHLWRQVAVFSADAAGEDCGPVSAALAKAAAVRSSRTARAVCQQLLGGMGFTWEHDFHRYLRRALTIEPLLGSGRDLHAELGAALRADAVGQNLVAL